MKLSMNFLVLVILFCAYSTKAQDDQSNDPGTDEDPSSQPDGIGQIDSKRAGRILDGTTVSIAEYPYVVSVNITNKVTYGAIISDTHVLTMAKNLFDLKSNNGPLSGISIRAGSNYKDKEGDLFAVAAYQLHSGYNTTTSENDVAVITISGTFSGKANVKPIAIATSEIPFSSTNPTNCFVLGWGLDFSPTDFSVVNRDLLGRATVKLVSGETCTGNPSIALKASFQCAQSVSGQACVDKGSPVVCNNQLYGIYPGTDTCDNSSPFGKLPVPIINSFIAPFLAVPTSVATGSQPTPRKNYMTCPCTTC